MWAVVTEAEGSFLSTGVPSLLEQGVACSASICSQLDLGIPWLGSFCESTCSSEAGLKTTKRSEDGIVYLKK